MSSLSSLLKQSSPDPEEVVKACNAALKESKTNVGAQHAKIVALLNLERYSDAVKVFNDFGDGLKEKAAIEYAYALYRNEQLAEAQEIASGRDDIAARHLEAQASYRLEDFVNAANIYRELWAAANTDEQTDLRLNLGATDAQLLWARKSDHASKKRPGKEDLETFEAAYNAACGCIARGELQQGEFLLKRAKEALTEDEKKDELFPITIQQIFVFASSGKIEQAESLWEDILIPENAMTSTAMIARMNQLTSPTAQKNPYLSQRILSTHSYNDQMFSFQRSILNQNIITHDLQAFKFNGVASSTARQLAQDPSPTISPSTNAASSANAAAHAQNQLGKIGLKSILPLLEKRPKDVGLLATIIQIYVLTNNFGAAVTVLEAFFKRLEESNSETDQDVRHAPGLVAIAVSLYSKEGKKSHVQTELAKAASYWRRKTKCPPELLRVAGLSLLNSDDKDSLEEAGKVFDTLHQQDKSDRFASAGLVAAYAQSDYSKVKAEADKLTPINRLTAGIDVDALENLGVPQSTDAMSAIINRKRAAAGASKPAKKRKSKLPKDYNPDKKPDPERWLPLRDRSSYRPKGKKGKQKQAALTQGGIEKDTPVEAQKSTPAAAGGGGSGKSKKKKNKK